MVILVFASIEICEGVKRAAKRSEMKKLERKKV